MAKLFVFTLLALLAYVQGIAQTKITIAVAANMQYAIEAVKNEFNKTDKTEIDVVLGASGKLTQQIMAGAPFDIFISADTAFPKKNSRHRFGGSTADGLRTGAARFMERGAWHKPHS